MTDKKRKKTLLEIEFELLIQDLKDSGLEVNENHREEIPLDKTFVTFIPKIKRKKGLHHIVIKWRTGPPIPV